MVKLENWTQIHICRRPEKKGRRPFDPLPKNQNHENKRNLTTSFTNTSFTATPTNRTTRRNFCPLDIKIFIMMNLLKVN